jgi:hypothetical protein
VKDEGQNHLSSVTPRLFTAYILYWFARDVRGLETSTESVPRAEHPDPSFRALPDCISGLELL